MHEEQEVPEPNKHPEEKLLTEQRPRARQVGVTIGIVAAVLVVVAILLAAGYGLMTHPMVTASLRDVSIIVLALVTMVTCILLAVLLFQLQSLLALLRDDIKPILESANETAGTVRGTATFMSDAVVSPVIRAASYAAGVRTAMRTFAGRPARRGGAQGPQKPEQ